MADRFVFDLNAEYPDVIVDTLRRYVRQAIDDLVEAATGVDDAYFLTDLIFTLLDSTIATAVDAAAEAQRLRGELDQLRADHDAIAARVTALETPGGSSA